MAKIDFSRFMKVTLTRRGKRRKWRGIDWVGRMDDGARFKAMEKYYYTTADVGPSKGLKVVHARRPRKDGLFIEVAAVWQMRKRKNA